MVCNEILITLTIYYKLVSTQDDGSCYIGVWRRLRRACMYALSPLTLTKYESSRRLQTTFRLLVPLDTPE